MRSSVIYFESEKQANTVILPRFPDTITRIGSYQLPLIKTRINCIVLSLDRIGDGRSRF